jgi:hypothetical protein
MVVAAEKENGVETSDPTPAHCTAAGHDVFALDAAIAGVEGRTGRKMLLDSAHLRIDNRGPAGDVTSRDLLINLARLRGSLALGLDSDRSREHEALAHGKTRSGTLWLSWVHCSFSPSHSQPASKSPIVTRLRAE